MTRARIAIAATDETGSAFASVRQKLDTLGTRSAALAGSFSGITSGVLGLVGGASLTAYFRQVVDGIDRLNDLKDATGASIGNLSALENVAARTGTSFETVQAALLKFNQALAGAKPGSAAAEVFRRLGLSLAELRSQDPAEALRKTAVALARFDDDGNKARAAMELFGRSLGQVAPLLGDLARSGQLVSTVTNEQAAAAEAFNIQLAVLGKNATDVARNVAGPLLDGLNQLFDAVENRGVGGFRELNEAVRIPLQAISVIGANVQFTLKGVGAELGGLAAQGAALARLDFEGFSAIGQAMRDDAKQAREEFDKLAARLMQIGTLMPKASYSNEGRRRSTESLGVIDDAALARQRQQVASVQQYSQQLRDQILATQQLGEEEKARIAINRGLYGVIDKGTQTQVLALAASLDSILAQQASARAYAALQQEGLAVTRSVLTEQERLTEQVQRAKVLVAAGAISWEAYDRIAMQGLGRLTTAVAGLDLPKLEQLAAPLQRVSEFATQAARNIQDALGDSVLQVIKGNSDSIGKIWQDLLQRMVAQALAAKLGEALFGNFGKTGEFGGLVGLIGSSVFGGARANGGPVMAGRAYLVGERGPEIVVPQSAGTVVPNGGIGGLSMVNHYRGPLVFGAISDGTGSQQRRGVGLVSC